MKGVLVSGIWFQILLYKFFQGTVYPSTSPSEVVEICVLHAFKLNFKAESPDLPPLHVLKNVDWHGLSKQSESVGVADRKRC